MPYARARPMHCFACAYGLVQGSEGVLRSLPSHHHMEDGAVKIFFVSSRDRSCRLGDFRSLYKKDSNLFGTKVSNQFNAPMTTRTDQPFFPPAAERPRAARRAVDRVVTVADSLLTYHHLVLSNGGRKQSEGCSLSWLDPCVGTFYPSARSVSF
ncbi:hypothetical protein BC830DRAFT_640272 [Chytriomyces sp. MP71]|nr:hypothetical protein BC830DRAFT_640272 [Chytriomyces sp. MP71]